MIIFALHKTSKGIPSSLTEQARHSAFKSRRVLCLFLSLFINIHRHAGLEFYRESVLVDSDIFNQPSDQLLIIFCHNGGLLPQECTHNGNPSVQRIPTCIFHLSLLLLFAQVVNLISFGHFYLLVLTHQVLNSGAQPQLYYRCSIQPPPHFNCFFAIFS